MLVECELALAGETGVREGTVESKAGEVLRSETHDIIDLNRGLREVNVASETFDNTYDDARLDAVRGTATTGVEVPD